MPPQIPFRLTPAALEALAAWNQRTTGQGLRRTGFISDPEVLLALALRQAPGEDLNQTICRICKAQAQ